MTLLAPHFLWLAAAVPLVWTWPGPARDRRHAALRSVTLLLVALALARPVRVVRNGAPTVVTVVDASRSIAVPPEARPGDLVLPRSSLSAGLAEADARIPAGASGAVVLATDGFATDRHWGEPAARLAARGVPVHVAPRATRPLPPRPVALRPLGELRAGFTARVAVDVAGDAGGRAVVLQGPDGVLARAAADGGTAVLEFEPERAGFLAVRALVGNEALDAILAVQDPRRVLYLGRRVEGGRARLAELVGPGFALHADGLDANPASYDLVVVDDRPATAFPPAAQARFARAVARDGLGLLMAGGPASFGPGGYHGGPLAEVLPVEFVQKEEKRDPSVALVVIIDTSGSMGGTRVQLAKEVARLAIRRLLPHDKVGIVEFYGAKRWAAPIQPASNSIEIQRALNRLDAGGGTVILPAIEEAYYGLQNVQARFKHVLVLTDGGVESGAFEPLLRRMAAKGMHVSTVLVGAQAHSSFLVDLATWGKGRFYSVPNRFNLPEVLFKQPTTARLPAYRRGAHAVRARGGRGWWGAVDPSAAPPLAGYVEARARPGADVPLETGRGGHPVVATWAVGAGRATAFLTEPVGPGTEPWAGWDDYGAFLARLFARTARDGTPYAFSLERRGRELHLRARRRVPGAAAPEAWLDGDASRIPFAFRRRTAQRWTAMLSWPPDRAARVFARAAGGARTVRLVSRPREDVAPELRVDPRHAADLAALARATGGEVVDAARWRSFDAPTGGGGRDWTAVRLWPWLLLAALLAYLADVAYRRWPRGPATS